MAQQVTPEGEATNDDSTDTDDLDPETETLLAAAEELETDCSGWTAIDQMGGAVANWVDDPDEPVFGVSVAVTGKTVPLEGEDEIRTREGVFGTQIGAHRRVSGYELVVGPTRTDGGTSVTIDEWYGDPEQSAHEVSQDIYLDVLRKARMWLRFHSPRTKRVTACFDGYGPNPLPEQTEDAGDGQGTLNQYDTGFGV